MVFAFILQGMGTGTLLAQSMPVPIWCSTSLERQIVPKNLQPLDRKRGPRPPVGQCIHLGACPMRKGAFQGGPAPLV
jgi:hypothetical protein